MSLLLADKWTDYQEKNLKTPCLLMFLMFPPLVKPSEM